MDWLWTLVVLVIKIIFYCVLGSICIVAAIRFHGELIVPKLRKEKTCKSDSKEALCKTQPVPTQTYVSPMSEPKNSSLQKEQYTDKLSCDEERYCTVRFHKDGKTYTYKCPDSSIKVGDYIRVYARGVEKTARVFSIFNYNNTNMQITKVILRKATMEEKKSVIYDFEAEDNGIYDDWKEHMSPYDRYSFERFALVDLPGYNHAELYLCPDDDILEGDKVLVKTKLCEEEAEVVATYYLFVYDLPKDILDYDDVIRKVANNPDSDARKASSERDSDMWLEVSEKAREIEQADTLREANEVRSKYEEMQIRELEAALAKLNKKLVKEKELENRTFNPMYSFDPLNVFYDDD